MQDIVKKLKAESGNFIIPLILNACDYKLTDVFTYIKFCMPDLKKKKTVRAADATHLHEILLYYSLYIYIYINNLK